MLQCYLACASFVLIVNTFSINGHLKDIFVIAGYFNYEELNTWNSALWNVLLVGTAPISIVRQLPFLHFLVIKSTWIMKSLHESENQLIFSIDHECQRMEILSLSFCVLKGTTLERIHWNAVFYVSDSILQAAKQSSLVSISLSSSVCLKGHKTLSYTVSSFFQKNIEVKVAQSCLTLCDPLQSMEFSRPKHWSGYPFPSPGNLPPRDQTQVSHIAGRFFTSWATREAHEY